MKQLLSALILYIAVIWTLPFPGTVFLRFIHIATKYVQFSFNNTVYQQIDGIAMSSPLGAVIFNIFVGFQEEKLFESTNKPLYYVRYVDEISVWFSSLSESIKIYMWTWKQQPSFFCWCPSWTP